MFRTPNAIPSHPETEVYVAILRYHLPSIGATTVLEPTEPNCFNLYHGIMNYTEIDAQGKSIDSEVYYIGKWQEVSHDDDFICEKVKFWMKHLHEKRGIKVKEFAALVPEELLIEHAKETGQEYGHPIWKK